MLFVVCSSIVSAGTVGKGPVMPVGRSPVGVATQVPGCQKNRLNDPGGGGGSFRYDLPGAGTAQPRAATWGQHFTMKPPDTHSHTEARWSTGCTLAEAMSVYPSWPPGWLAACPAAVRVAA